MIKNQSLQVFEKGKLIFSSDKKWLYPLLDLHSFLIHQKLDHQNLVVLDKIVGRASALLLVHIGVNLVRAKILSKLGKEIFQKFEINFEYEKLVDRIDCQTEEILKNEMSPSRALQMIQDKAENK